MSGSDLNQLRIERGPAVTAAKRWRPGRKTLAVLILVLAAAGYYFLAPSRFEASAGVSTLLYPSRALTLLTASGYVVADRKASLATKATAQLVWLGVEEGSRVKAGDVLARLESRDLTAAIERAEADVNAAEHRVAEAEAELIDATLKYQRYGTLIKGDYVARSDHDAAKARHDTAQAALRRAKADVLAKEAALREERAQLEYTLIRAPFDAVVLTKNADVGDIISPLGASTTSKAAVVSIADMSSLQVEVDVSESNLEKVKTGGPCEILLDAIPEARFPGRVHMIVPTADRTKATVLVKIRFETLDPRVMPEMSAKAAFLSRALAPGEDTPKVAAPASAVTRRDGRDTVFAVKDGKAQALTVTLGESVGESREILSGLEPGTRLVLDPPAKLADGDAIVIKES